MTVALDTRQFTGTEVWYKSIMPGVTYTEGVKYVADTAGAHWLIDKIATLQMLPQVKAEAFQGWKLKVVNDAGTLICDDGDGNVVYSEKIEWTDFPAPGIEFWFTDNVILLPSEY